MDYLLDQLAQPLIEAVCDICLKKPEDPIQHLAHYLYKYHRENMEQSNNEQPANAQVPNLPMESRMWGSTQEQPAKLRKLFQGVFRSGEGRTSASFSGVGSHNAGPRHPGSQSTVHSAPMDSDHMDFLDFDLPVSKESSSAGSSVEMMMTCNEKAAVHVHQDAIKVHEDLFDDDDLL